MTVILVSLEVPMENRIGRRAIYAVVTAIFVFGVVIIGVAILRRPPENCALCGYGDGTLHHAPVLIDLSDGTSLEMRVYDQLVTKANEISQIQQTGTFSLVSLNGNSGYRDTCDQTCRIFLPTEGVGYRTRLFCDDCKNLLKECSDYGYALADLYDRDSIEVFNIAEGVSHTIRDYEVTAEYNSELDELELVVHGIAEGLTFVD